MIIDAYDVMIEVTRRCNMTCEHCLRGDAQNKNMKREYYKTLFSKLNSISCLTFTGGEPSLVPQIIEDIRLTAIEEKVSIDRFYVVTNTKSITDKFVESLKKFQEYCDSSEECRISYSNDDFHEGLNTVGIGKLIGAFDIDEDGNIREEDYRLVSPKGKIDRKYIINEGRGSQFGGDRIPRDDKFLLDVDDDRVIIEEGMLYLNCKGNLLNCCDLSYESQDEPENIICHVNDFSIEKLESFITNEDSLTALKKLMVA